MSYVKYIRKFVGNAPLQLPGTGVIVWRRNQANELEFLFQLRTDHNRYGLLGGGIELGESYEECALRELKEEAGLIASERSLHLMKVYAGKEHVTCHQNGDVVYHTVVVYNINYEECISDEFESSETKALKWMSKEPLLALLEEAEKNFFHNNIPIIWDIVNKFFC